MAYCGVYQGDASITTVNASTVTLKADTNIDVEPIANDQPPLNRRDCRTVTSRPATISITKANSVTQ